MGQGVGDSLGSQREHGGGTGRCCRRRGHSVIQGQEGPQGTSASGVGLSFFSLGGASFSPGSALALHACANAHGHRC